MPSSDLSHCITARVTVPAAFAFDFLADPLLLGSWSLGCMRTQPTEIPGVYTGFSQFDGGQGWFAIDASSATRLIDYRVGPPDALVHRISARVIPGGNAGLGDDTCLVMLIAWRMATMDDARWNRLCAAHEAEIWLIKEQAEALFRSNR